MPQWFHVLLTSAVLVLVILLGFFSNRIIKSRILYKTLNLDFLEIIQKFLRGSLDELVDRKWDEYLNLASYRVLDYVRKRYQDETREIEKVFLKMAMEALQEDDTEWATHRESVPDEPSTRKWPWSTRSRKVIHLEIRRSLRSFESGQQQEVYIICGVPEHLASMDEKIEYLSSLFD